MPGTKKNFTLPYEQDYTDHWEEERRHKESKDWLLQRERAIESSLALAQRQPHTEGEAE
jgi:hypothetical protein